MNTPLIILMLAFAVPATIEAQVEPAATGPTRIGIRGILNYSARTSQATEMYGDTRGNEVEAILSGDLGYATGSEKNPFSMNFSGGYNWALSGINYGTGPYENLMISQGFIGRNGSLVLTDNLGYHKQSPLTGFSGEPGTGESIGGSGTTTTPGESILTLNTRTIDNSASATWSHRFGTVTLSSGGSGMILRYPDGNGNGSNQIAANAGVSERLNARNTLSEQYMFTTYSYLDSNISFDSNSVLFGYTRQWTRNIQSTLSAGPQWVMSGSESVSYSSIGMSVSGTVTDKLRSGSASLTGSHGFDGGGGYMYGSKSDQISGAFSHGFGKKLTVEFTGGWRQNNWVTSSGVIESKFGASQLSGKLGRHFSWDASYTGTVQSSSGSVPTNVLSSLWQVISFGISFNPAPVHLRGVL